VCGCITSRKVVEKPAEFVPGLNAAGRTATWRRSGGGKALKPADEYLL
jgi:hypothetical protein